MIMKKSVLLLIMWVFACSSAEVESASESGDCDGEDSPTGNTCSDSEADSADTSQPADTEVDGGGADDDTAVNAQDSDTGPWELDTHTSNESEDTSDSEVDSESIVSPDGGTERKEYAVEIALSQVNDAVSSYLMDAAASAWNYISGDAVPLGRKRSVFDDNVSYHTALRFQEVDIPAGAEILTAELRFSALSSVQNSRNLWINIYANRAGNCAPFDPGNYKSNRPDQRLRTKSHIDHWLVRCNDSCTEITEYDCEQRKLDCWTKGEEVTVPKDLKEILAEVVALPDWESGNALCVFLFNAATKQDGAKYEDSRTIIGYSIEEAIKAPRLRITYLY